MPAHKCTRAEFEKVRRRHALRAKTDECYIYGVFTKRNPRLVGMLDFSIYERKTMKFANFGYRIFNRYWGQGLGQEAAKAGLRIGIRQLKLQRLEASIDLDNQLSIRLVKAIGMRREGVKKNYWYQDGKWEDQLVYVANPSELR